MIRINLLPEEFRRGQRIPARVLATAFGSAIAACAAIGWFGLVYFGELGEAEAQHAAVTAELTEKTRKAAYFDQLDANQKDYRNRVETIQMIGKSRRLWSKFIDEMLEVVNSNGETERHLAWFDSMSVHSDPKRGAGVDMPGFVQGNEFARVANLHEDIEAAPFAHEIASKSAPYGSVLTTKDREPPESVKFNLHLQFAPQGEDPKTQKAKK